MRAVLSALVFALVVAGVASAAPPRSVVHPARAGVVARVSLQPRTVVFGDRVTADIDIALDRTRIDPGDVHLAVVFAPYARAAKPETSRHDAGGVTRLHWTYPLVCFDHGCSTAGSRLRVNFPPVRIYFRPRSAHGQGALRRVLVRWPLLLIDSQLDPQAIAKSKLPLDVPPWHADVSSLPDVTYRGSPAGLRFGLFLAAAALLGASGMLVLAGLGGRVPIVRRRRPTLPPLEQALAHVERAQATGEPREQRKALELLAGELRGRGADGLAGDAVELAWAQPGPERDATGALAGEVRKLIRSGGNGRRG